MDLNHHRTGQGSPLILIHGIGSRWQMWAPVLDELAREHEVIALDLPGFGESTMPPAGTRPGLDSLLALVGRFLDQLGIEQPHAAGNSLGGLIVLEMARRGLVRSATALSPAGFANRPETVVSRAVLWASARGARLMAPRAGAIFASPTARRLALGAFVARPAAMSPAEAAANVRALAAAPWFDATLPTLKARQFGSAATVSVPITVAWGDKDRVLLPRQSRRAARAIPGARTVALAGCGHVPTYDDPALVTRVLLTGAAD